MPVMLQVRPIVTAQLRQMGYGPPDAARIGLVWLFYVATHIEMMGDDRSQF
jgi:hypothetical protein